MSLLSLSLYLTYHPCSPAVHHHQVGLFLQSLPFLFSFFFFSLKFFLSFSLSPLFHFFVFNTYRITLVAWPSIITRSSFFSSLSFFSLRTSNTTRTLLSSWTRMALVALISFGTRGSSPPSITRFTRETLV